jgi:hypothetical protein
MELDKYTLVKPRMECDTDKVAWIGLKAVFMKEPGRTIELADKVPTSKMGQHTLEFSKRISSYRESTSPTIARKSIKEAFPITSSKEKED